MSEYENPRPHYRLWPPSPETITSLVTIGIAVACIAAGFAYVGGYLTPQRLTQARIIDRFEQINGVHPGFRRNHAKGVCIAGTFDSNGNGTALSTAAVFEKGTTPVTGRFAVAVGKPFVPDNETEVRSMALSFRLRDGEEWRTGMNDIPVFPVRNAQAFYEQMLAARPDPATGKPDPSRMQSFLAAHPETAKALQAIKARPFSTGFANASYNSLDAFRFVNGAGVSTPVRWSMEAVDPFVAEGQAGVNKSSPTDVNYLFDDLIARLAKGPVQWHLVVTIGTSDDATADATVAWPETRTRLTLGTLTIDRIATEAPGNCSDVNFDPLVLPAGIAPSDDPLLSARSATYSNSFRRRAAEAKTPSEVQVPNVTKGASP